jgi:hypothetical protein
MGAGNPVKILVAEIFLTCGASRPFGSSGENRRRPSSSIFSLQRDDVTVTTFSANLVLGNHAPAEDTGMALFIWVALLVISLASIAAFLRAIHMIDLPTM